MIQVNKKWPNLLEVFLICFYWISGIFYSKFRSNNKLSVNRALNINLFRNLCDHFATFSSHKLNRWKMTKPSQPSFWSMAKIFAVVQSNYDTIHFLIFLKKIEPFYVLFHDLSFISKNLIQNNNRKNLIRKKRFNFSNRKNTKKNCYLSPNVRMTFQPFVVIEFDQTLISW